ncbi:helix-turn-helix domain-containing protein [Campylobacter estrildidarum]|uniref:XRE family transcriptional regulator n=1 Tax=Campylobacter estrildidarum TaxID=2510189 RepID=A0A4U7BIY1_9BACT|nr:helix-turn-helix transcriptional regulator [Campylobacter estrildidarum]TKX31489.1 XRE family transcriptional regulator [Campylobacter estrildidarum]
MKVVDRINEILKEKNISKKELANRLINLGMKANKTGEIPTLSSIYAYLNGNIDIKADMIPFIADALGIFEQELFSDKKEENFKIINKLYKNKPLHQNYAELIELFEFLSPKNLEILEEILLENKAKSLEISSLLRKKF